MHTAFLVCNTLMTTVRNKACPLRRGASKEARDLKIDTELPDDMRTQSCWCLQEKIRTLTTMAGSPVSSSFSNKTLNLQMAKAALQSNSETIEWDPCLRKCCTTSVTVNSHVHCVVLVFCLNPNCTVSLLRRCPQMRRITFSNRFRIRLEPAIALYEEVSAGSGMQYACLHKAVCKFTSL